MIDDRFLHRRREEEREQRERANWHFQGRFLTFITIRVRYIRQVDRLKSELERRNASSNKVRYVRYVRYLLTRQQPNLHQPEATDILIFPFWMDSVHTILQPPYLTETFSSSAFPYPSHCCMPRRLA